MAQDWTIVTQYPDVETNGGKVARDVMIVGTETKAHGVYFELSYPQKGFTAKTPQSNSAGYTIILEALFEIPGVEAVTTGERLNAANQLEKILTVYYTSTSGDSENFVTVPFSKFTQEHIAGLVDSGRAVLDANEEA